MVKEAAIERIMASMAKMRGPIDEEADLAELTTRLRDTQARVEKLQQLADAARGTSH